MTMPMNRRAARRAPGAAVAARWGAVVAALFWATVAGLRPVAIAQEGGAEGAPPAEAQSATSPTHAPLSSGLPPTVWLTAVPGYGEAPLTVGFFAEATDPESVGVVTYHWNFGNGDVSTLPPMTFFETYNQPGSYLVTLTVVTADGRSATALAGIVVQPTGIQ